MSFLPSSSLTCYNVLYFISEKHLLHLQPFHRCSRYSRFQTIK
jgi:hypothetical protein